MRMPRPPPPADAFTINGKPISRASFKPSSSDVTASGLPGTTGKPASCITRRASILSPIMRITFADGPMNLMLQASQISAKYGDSARKP